jgi:putative acetyltransferase
VFPENPAPDISIRAASNRDCDAVKRLVFAVLAEHGLKGDSESIDADLDDLEGNYQARGGFFDVFETSEGSIAGSIGIYPLDPDTCELRKMYFAPSIRGRGLGKFAVRRAIQRAKALGFKRIVLETSSKLETARHLYLSFGFKPTTSNHLASRADEAYALDL